MARIILETIIHAPAERCFLLSLSVDMHTFSTAHTQERVVGGTTSGIMKPGEYVTWRAKHFGIWQELSSKITAYHFPTYFCDEMIRGAFKHMRHEHHFITKQDYTLMRDIFYFESPFIIAGKVVNKVFLQRYMENLLVQRNKAIKSVAEGEQWRKFLPS